MTAVTDVTNAATATSAAAASSTTSTTAASATSAQGELNSNYNTFLKLLTTQLQNQDPLDPTDSSQFTNQLVLFSQVEQQIDTNSTLDTMLTNQTSNMAQQALSYLGLNVAASGNTITYDGSSVTAGYTLPSAAATATVGIFNSSGTEVYTTSGGTAAGSNEFTWDGTDSSGDAVASGLYTVQVTAADASGNPITASTVVPGIVTGVSNSNGTTYLTINGEQVAASSVVSAAEPASSSN